MPAFLEQASAITGNDKLIKVSDEFTKAGDLWRTSAINMGRIYKGRLNEQKDFEESANLLNEIAKIERQAFKTLRSLKF